MSEAAERAQLTRLRSEVDALDLRLLEILAERIDVVRELSTYKIALGVPLCDPKRESEMAELHARWAERLDLPQELVSELFAVVLRSSRDLQAGLRHSASRSAATALRSPLRVQNGGGIDGR